MSNPFEAPVPFEVSATHKEQEERYLRERCVNFALMIVEKHHFNNGSLSPTANVTARTKAVLKVSKEIEAYIRGEGNAGQ